MVKHRLPVHETRETQVQPLDWEDPLEQEMTTCSVFFSEKIPWTEEPGGLQSSRPQESDMTERLSTHKAHAVFDCKSDAHLLSSFEALRFFTFCIHPHIFAGFLLCARWVPLCEDSGYSSE